MTRTGRAAAYLVRASGLAAAMVCAACAGWATYFAVYALLPALVLLALALQPIVLRPRLTWRLRAAAVVLSLALGALLVGPILQATQRASDTLTAQLRRAGPRSLNVVDLSGLLALWTFVGVATAPIAPEFAAEHFLMVVPSDGTRTFDSDFPMDARPVASRVRGMAQRLGGRTEAVFPPERIAFDYARDPLRTALALNPIHVSAVARVREGRRVLEVEGPRRGALSRVIAHPDARDRRRDLRARGGAVLGAPGARPPAPVHGDLSLDDGRGGAATVVGEPYRTPE